MRLKLITIPAFLLVISVLTACGKGGDKTPLLRLVKVIVLGQASDANQIAQANKDPGSLNFDASGKVTEVLAKRGDCVQAG